MGLRHVNPPTKRGYWLYLPKAFSLDRRWPLVVTLHGMKPFDNSTYQIHEWEPVADDYGFVVVAPDLGSADLMGEFPLRNPANPALLLDELVVLSIVEEICTSVPINTDRILLTSWSSGGYVSHYLMNRHPELFTALAARESNFHPGLMDPKLVENYRHKPIIVFYGENDFAGVKREAIASAAWYREHKFTKLREQEIPRIGHQRRPGIAADFFVEKGKEEPGECEITADPVMGQVPLTVQLGIRLPPTIGTPSEVRWFFGPDREPIGVGRRVTKELKEPGHYPVEARIAVNGSQHVARIVIVAKARPMSAPSPPTGKTGSGRPQSRR